MIKELLKVNEQVNRILSVAEKDDIEFPALVGDLSAIKVYDQPLGIHIVLGIIDESDILFAVHQNKDNFKEPVKKFMTTNVITISPRDSIDSMVTLFNEDTINLGIYLMKINMI